MSYQGPRGVPPERKEAILHWVAQGKSATQIARTLHISVGKVRTVERYYAKEWKEAREKAKPTPTAGMTPTEGIRTEMGDSDGKASSFTRDIKTVEDLVKRIELDTDKYEVHKGEATKNEVITKDPETGEVTTTEYYRVFVGFKVRSGQSTREIADAFVEAALREHKFPAIKTVPKVKGGVWQVQVIADPHFGKYAWGGTTGYEDYDLRIARDHVLEAGYELLERGDQNYRLGRRTLAFLGDIFHYDTPTGTTTSGTPLERDGRLPKLIDAATDTVIDLILRSASTVPTDVLFVRGNHDEAMTSFLQKTIRERFRDDRRVTVEPTHTHRKYLAHQGNLLGFTHGDKAKKVLAQLMPHEAKQHWADAKYYEIHTGHIHQQRAEWSRPVESIDGVLVRVAPAICPPDDWHADNGFVGKLMAMESFFYRDGGGILGMHVSSPSFSPDLHEAAP